MATNPMQRKSRNAFLLGMLLMLLIAAAVVVLLYMKIRNQQDKINEYQQSTRNVYVLNQDVKSGQTLTTDMFALKPASTTVIPIGATGDIITTLASYSLSTNDGRAIYFSPSIAGNSEQQYYYLMAGNDKKQIYVEGNNGDAKLATNLLPSSKAFFYGGNNNTEKNYITVSENAVVAKVDMNANTIITSSLITRSDEVTTNDLRKEEYNIISLPVDLKPGEYVDIRLRLPNGQNYIVVSKKKVSIPVVNGQYLADTIQMNLTEEEILILSGAIVESYKTTGSVLYATRYAEAGLQAAATMTYYPNSDVQQAIQNDPNVVLKAIQGIRENREQVRKSIDSATSKYENEENASKKTEESIEATEEARKNYLQTLPVIQ